ncbi:MAG: hypothetical protein DRJ64_01235 [Thermoprotei archaeon]|nr:MAG: hypothetical protein DRJ64_01235 [Thermoprotei archaeon]
MKTINRILQMHNMKKEKIVSSIEIETFSHATERRERVLKALLNLIPKELRNKIEENIKFNTLQGHYGNPIIFYRVKVTRDRGAQEIVEYILSNIDKIDSEIILHNIQERVDKSSFYLRLNKQNAYLGKFTLYDGDDVIRIKISFLPHIRGLEKIKTALFHLGLKETAR